MEAEIHAWVPSIPQVTDMGISGLPPDLCIGKRSEQCLGHAAALV